MARTAVLGFPRIGPERELKFALEDFWRGQLPVQLLAETATRLRSRNLTTAQLAGIDVVPVGDFAYYDHVLDAAELVGVIATRHGGAEASGLNDHFVAACGTPRAAPLALARWFDTGYHYLVPEVVDDQTFELRAESLTKWLDDINEARALGLEHIRPVLIGPFSLLMLSTVAGQQLSRLPELTLVYSEILSALHAAGATEVQLDEPCLVLDQSADALDAFAAAYAELLAESPLEVALVTYFAGLDDAVLARISSLRLAELHVDLVRAPDRLEAVLEHLPGGARLSAGVIDGRNVWAVDVDRALNTLDRIVAVIGSDRLTIAPSCSLLHVPYTAAREQDLDPQLQSWLAFGDEKLEELTLLQRALTATADQRDVLLADARARSASRAASPIARDGSVRTRTTALTPSDYDRGDPIGERLAQQAERLQLPELPTTTMGALPQTTEIRRARTERGSGEISDVDYIAAVRRQIDEMIELQEMLELDVFVQGEPERRDLVEYFSERLSGFALSEFGWVQTYGNRAVKPPILYGDVARRDPMVVDWWHYAQSITERPVKATVTGPVTILQRSFVRDDQPSRETCLQIALAIHDEVADLDAADAAIVQIDEAALGEGVPLRRADRAAYVRWATDCLRLTTSPARAATQIHMHLCEIGAEEFIEGIGRIGADVISTDDMRALEALGELDYPGGVGPGIYDVQTRRIPTAEDLEMMLERAEQLIPRDRLWVNPNCGLKTRPWPETLGALSNLVQAAKNRRAEVGSPR
jgi:5-methyltetrahydropteroyltriglutamate--homocysteine methyltransferase